MNKLNCLALTFLGFISLLTQATIVLATNASADTTPLNIAESAKLAKISGADLSEIHGESYESINVFAVKYGRLVNIPSQFDEYAVDGSLYFKKAKVPMSGVEGVVDEHDILKFRLADTGPKLNKKSLHNILQEIEIKTRHGARYVYLVKDTYLVSQQSYVVFDEEQGYIKTEFYSQSFDPDNFFIWGDYMYKDYDKDKLNRAPTILDTMKLRMSGGLFTKDATITLDNYNLSSNIVEVKRGRISTQILVKAYLQFAKVPVMKIWVAFEFNPQSYEFDARFKIPFIAKATIRNPSVSLSLDGYRVTGSKLSTSWAPQILSTINGRIDDIERQLLQENVDNTYNWIWFGTNRGFDLLASVNFKDNFDLPIKLVYEDERYKENEPERYPGQGPNVGYRIENIPPGKDFGMSMELSFNKDSGDLTPSKYAEYYYQDLGYTIRNY